jgi:ribosomal protein S18 acetylase RimI-like enzyme
MDETTIPRPEVEDSPILIEHAKPEDAEAIMMLKRAAWFAAYPNEEHGVSAEDIRKKFTEDDLRVGIENWHRGIANETENGNRTTFVARTKGRVVGYASPCIEEEQRRIGALYVSPDSQGQGIGSKLLGKALEWHGSDQDIYLRVLSYNDNAIRLYEKFGFQKTGIETPEEFDEQQGIKLLPEIEMVRKAVH